MQEDKEIILKAVQGDRRAFEKLVKRHYPEISRYLATYRLDNQEIEDLAQEVFIRAYQKISLLKAPYDFRPWLFKMAANLANSRYQNQKILTEITEQHSDSNKLQENSEQTTAIIAVINNLNSTLRTVTKMHLLYGMSIESIRERLQIPDGTVKRRLHDARNYIRKEFAKMDKSNAINTAPQIEIKESHDKLTIRTDHLKAFFGSKSATGSESILHEYEYPGAVLSSVRVISITAEKEMMGKRYKECLDVSRKKNEVTAAVKVYINSANNRMAFSVIVDENGLPAADSIQSDVEYGELQSGMVLHGQPVVSVEIKIGSRDYGKCLRVTFQTPRANQENEELKYLRNILADYYYEESGQLILIRIYEQINQPLDLLKDDDDRRLDKDGLEYRLRRDIVLIE